MDTTSTPPRFRRGSGILLHPTSLPGGYGIGDFGPEARRFVDFLVEAEQRAWQILPLGPTGFGNSPYAALSAFAGNPLLISLDRLADEGLIRRDELAASTRSSSNRVDFGSVVEAKGRLLRSAAAAFLHNGSPPRRAQLASFRETNASWLDDYTLYMALRETHGAPWQSWNSELVRREPAALERARHELHDTVALHEVLQFFFAEQWTALHLYARERGISLIGDIPIFVAPDSADVWAHPDLFYLNERGHPTIVAGVPPDYFSKTGQLWGNPLYRWDVLAERGYDWWIDRFRATFQVVDLVRIDHFRGFESYWAVPASEPTAEHGTWEKGPGLALFTAVRRALGSMPIIIEDLGLITPAVVALRDELGNPGMKVLQFAWDSGPTNPFLPHNYEPNCVVYTGTHDNDTTVGWYQAAPEADRAHLRDYFNVDGREVAWDLIRAAMASVADLAIIPVQDVLALGTEHRMNLPGRREGNWSWRLIPGQLEPKHSQRLAHLAALYGRSPKTTANETESTKPA